MLELELPQPRAAAAWHRLDRRLDAAFGTRANPLRQLGTLGFLAFWLLAVSGIWLYAMLETSASGAYLSIERLSRSPWSPGGLMRSLHRYSADAFVLLTALHLLREASLGRWRHFRRFSWLTGTAVLPLLAIAAVGGFWLNWDRLGQFSAVATAELLDALPMLAGSLARNFIGVETISDRLFSLFVFVHLGVSLLALFGLWFHLQRLPRAAVFPPPALAAGTVATLALLAAVAPVAGQGAADLSSVPARLALDWLLLAVHPLMYATSAGFTWGLLLGAFGLLLVLPLLPAGSLRSRAAALPAAVVDAANCNGCRRCEADCPYGAITMVPHPDARPGTQLARVDAARCAGCGICAGACPSATPFRSASALVSGIDLPQLTADTLRRRLREGLAASPAARPVVVFGCAQGADPGAMAAPDVVAIALICSAQLAPSFVEYALRDGAAHIVVASCRDGGCAFRHGARITAERLARRRAPRLRASVPRAQVHRVEADAGEEAILAAALARVRPLPPARALAPAAGGAGHPVAREDHGRG